MNPPRARTAYAVTTALLFIGNGPVFPIVAYYLRHETLTSATWRAYLGWSLAIGVALPLSIIAAVTAVTFVARRADRPPLTMFLFALFWSAPGLISNHDAISDWRHGPKAIVEQVRDTAHVQEDVGQGNAVHMWTTCVLTFDDGSKRTLDRYAVKVSTEDPCHGMRAGDRVRLTVLPRVDELVSIEEIELHPRR